MYFFLMNRSSLLIKNIKIHIHKKRSGDTRSPKESQWQLREEGSSFLPHTSAGPGVGSTDHVFLNILV